MVVGDLWPSVSSAVVRSTPLAVLKDQARRLGEKTSGKLEAELVTFPVHDQLRHNFEIVAPTLGGYRFLLFSVTHPAELYPMDVMADSRTGSSRISNEAEFEVWLRETFGSERTKNILANLLSQVDALAA